MPHMGAMAHIPAVPDALEVHAGGPSHRRATGGRPHWPARIRLGIEALAELQAEGAGAGAGVHHPQFGNRSAGGEGAVLDAEYYVLYVVTEDAGSV